MPERIEVDLAFILNDQWVASLLGDDAGLAIIKILNQVDRAVRRSVREQLRRIIAEGGGDPWNHNLREPEDPRARPRIDREPLRGDFGDGS